MVYWGGCIGIMENKLETTMVYWGIYGVILGSYKDNGKENGNCYLILGVYFGVIVPLKGGHNPLWASGLLSSPACTAACGTCNDDKASEILQLRPIGSTWATTFKTEKISPTLMWLAVLSCCGLDGSTLPNNFS